MIPRIQIIEWQLKAPWPNQQLVEHDLVLSRAICTLYQHPLLREQLVFRGGTALHKLFISPAGRFSEDLDFVQKTAAPIGEIVMAIRDCLDGWLGKPKWKQSEGRFTISYCFQTTTQPVSMRKIKIEINTREHFYLKPLITKNFVIESRWYSSQADVLTYSLEELMATKLRALYQRKKGRDLYDFWSVMQHVSTLDYAKIVEMFIHYMDKGNTSVSRAKFEENLFLKRDSALFKNDIAPLLTAEQASHYRIDEAYQLLHSHFIPLLKGESWKGLKK